MIGGGALVVIALIAAIIALSSPDKPAETEAIADGQEHTTASGLRYIIAEQGDGAQAVAGSTVAVHYVGSLEDGTVFDSSYDRGQPIEFVLGTGSVIPGWDEGIALLREGGRATLIIPPDLAYGPGGSPPAIPPNATLTFEVELVSVQGP